MSPKRGDRTAPPPIGGEYEVTGGGRIWYLLDDANRTAWITYAGTGHPKA